VLAQSVGGNNQVQCQLAIPKECIRDIKNVRLR
jgi:hypothetical protein